MRQDLADLTIVLDRSGSMSAVKADTIGGFNTFLRDQQQVPGDARLTLVQFDTEYEFVHRGAPIRDVPPLNDTTFVPRGGTALLDAVGRAINEAGARLAAIPEADRPGKVIFVILTDGGENSSTEYTRDRVFQMISHQREKYAWEFVFIGANQDAIAAGQSLGIAKGSSMTYAANAVGTQSAFASTSNNLRSYRTGLTPDAAFTDDDRKKQADAGAATP
jgi:hypothetical protein